MTTSIKPVAVSGNLSSGLQELLAKRLEPAILTHNRLEGVPRSDRFERALKCEVRDALFLLTRQFLFGEYQADDTGSAAFATLNIANVPITAYQPGTAASQAYSDDLPLEAMVERRPLPTNLSGVDVSIDIRLLMGRQWLKMIRPLGDFSSDFFKVFPITPPSRPEESNPHIGAQSDTWCLLTTVSGHAMDGLKLYEYLTSDPLHHSYDEIRSLAGQSTLVLPLEQQFVAWYERVLRQPKPKDDAWASSRLEYKFSCAANWKDKQEVLTAEEYYHGRLDWYNVDVDRHAPSRQNPQGLSEESEVQTVLPARVSFTGMPNTRLWSFEDGRTNLADMRPGRNELSHLLLLEFALVYANDWMLIPCTLKHGLAKIRGLVVTSVFGERQWIDAAGSSPEEGWQQWGMYQLDTKWDRDHPAESTLLLLPTPTKVQEGRAREEIVMVRDEVFNAVWGIEETIALPSGESKSGTEAARETRNFFQARIDRELAQAPITGTRNADDEYRLMNSVRENWIPFIPVHVEKSDREIKLQRASLPRVLDNDPKLYTTANDSIALEKVKPRTSILREGLDAAEPRAFFVLEEEVPRAGVRVKMTFRRTRWRDGSVCVWLGMRKRTGRGEFASELAFDQVVGAQVSGVAQASLPDAGPA